MATKPLKIGFVAGEVSSDLLASRLLCALRAQYAGTVDAAGVAGPALSAQGCKPIANIEELSLLGLIEPIIHLPRLYRLQKRLIHFFEHWRADAVIGVDSGDFNIPLLSLIRKKNIATFQFISPQVWAWRSYRVHKIKRAVSKVFCLFPFEHAFYQKFAANSVFVGHPMADDIPEQIDVATLRQKINIAQAECVFAMLPGSRKATFNRMAPVFLQAAALLHQSDNSVTWNVALVRPSFKASFEKLKALYAPDVTMRIYINEVRDAVASADLALTVSGTATLEIMLLKKPMIVANKISKVGYQLAKRLIKIPAISLPNLLTSQQIVPELIQSHATPQQILSELIILKNSATLQQLQVEAFTKQHLLLKNDAANVVAAEILREIADSQDEGCSCDS